MGVISYLSYGWNKLFSIPTMTPQQDSQDLKELKKAIVTEIAATILSNDYMQQSPQNWEEIAFTEQFTKQFPDQISGRIAEVFSKAAYKPQSRQETKNILLEQTAKGIVQAQFTKASIGVEKKALHAHQALSTLAWISCHFYAKNWFIYNTILNPTWVYDEEQLNNHFIVIEDLIERSMRDMADCINGINVGYLIQVGFSRDLSSIIAEPIDFEEIVKIDVQEAITMNTMPPYLTKLLDKVPERLSNHRIMQHEYDYLLKKVGQTQETPQHLAINEFTLKRTREICEKIFYPYTPIFLSSLGGNNW